jgi:histidine triad (HIT) family protein
MGDCPFCEIAHGLAAWPPEFSSHDGVMTFEPLRPFVPGHRLVVPVTHVEDILGAHPALVGQVMARAAAFALRLQVEFGADGVNILTSAGEAATQTVMHWHVHVIPRRHSDALSGWPWR